MPAKLKPMAAFAKGAKPMGGTGPSPDVAQQFVKAPPKKKRSLFMKGMNKNVNSPGAC